MFIQKFDIIFLNVANSSNKSLSLVIHDQKNFDILQIFLAKSFQVFSLLFFQNLIKKKKGALPPYSQSSFTALASVLKGFWIAFQHGHQLSNRLRVHVSLEI
ncbi:MAG: hypothetical protein CM15mV138_010 [Caudoviricetes sp.]|nr:MAG: hypothetical protein CM15mV138_010 [Caudoviricetes sp.]